MDDYLKFAIDIAKYAGKEIKDSFNKVDNITFKGDRTPVTEVDKKINHYLIERVKEEYPLHSVIGEEEISDNKSNYVWVCDQTCPIMMQRLNNIFQRKPLISRKFSLF